MAADDSAIRSGKEKAVVHCLNHRLLLYPIDVRWDGARLYPTPIP